MISHMVRTLGVLSAAAKDLPVRLSRKCPMEGRLLRVSPGAFFYTVAWEFGTWNQFVMKWRKSIRL